MKTKGNDKSFFRYIVAADQLIDWLVMALTVAAGCLAMVHFYPYPCMISDSFGYLLAALEDRFIPFRPFGYSAFLQMVNACSRSIYSIIISNALIYLLSAGLLLLAVKKYWTPSKKWRFRIFEILAVISPLSIFMLNTVLSDTLFCSLILLMAAMMIVMLMEKSIGAAVLFLIAFYFSLNVRYSAVFFPLAFLPVLAFYWKRFFGILTMAGTVVAVMVYHDQRTERMNEAVGIKQFSTGFDGWQLANNGIHVIPFLDEDDMLRPEDKDVASIHQFCLSFKNQIAEVTHNGKVATANFMWSSESPLKQLVYYYCDQTRSPYLSGWVYVGSGVFAKYGKWLIIHFPGKFIKYYLWPNMKQMVMPASFEVVGSYMEVPDGKEEFIKFFDVKDGTVYSLHDDGFKAYVRPVMPYLELITWLMLLGSAIGLILSKSLAGADRDTKLTLLMVFLFGFIYYGTTTFASPIAIRYWMPMHAVKLVFVWIALKTILANAARKRKTADKK